MLEVTLILIFLFLFYRIARLVYFLFRLVILFLKGEIDLSKDEKQRIKKDFKNGLILVLRRIFLFK